jgi:hypothetical protein
MDWLLIPRQLLALAWALLGLGLVYLAVKLAASLRR